MTEGTCADQGYTVDDGHKAADIPFVGNVNFALYTKPKEVKVGSNVSLYSVMDGICDQV